MEAGLERNREAGKRDRLELEALEFHMKVREGFLAIAKAEPGRVRIVDAARTRDEVHADVLALALEALAKAANK